MVQYSGWGRGGRSPPPGAWTHPWRPGRADGLLNQDTSSGRRENPRAPGFGAGALTPLMVRHTGFGMVRRDACQEALPP